MLLEYSRLTTHTHVADCMQILGFRKTQGYQRMVIDWSLSACSSRCRYYAMRPPAAGTHGTKLSTQLSAVGKKADHTYWTALVFRMKSNEVAQAMCSPARLRVRARTVPRATNAPTLGKVPCFFCFCCPNSTTLSSSPCASVRLPANQQVGNHISSKLFKPYKQR
jgi:hypothetical protein